MSSVIPTDAKHDSVSIELETERERHRERQTDRRGEKGREREGKDY